MTADEPVEAREDLTPLLPWGRLHPALVKAMQDAIDSQIMPIRGSRNNEYAAQACAAVAQRFGARP